MLALLLLTYLMSSIQTYSMRPLTVCVLMSGLQTRGTWTCVPSCLDRDHHMLHPYTPVHSHH